MDGAGLWGRKRGGMKWESGGQEGWPHQGGRASLVGRFLNWSGPRKGEGGGAGWGGGSDGTGETMGTCGPGDEKR